LRKIIPNVCILLIDVFLVWASHKFYLILISIFLRLNYDKLDVIDYVILASIKNGVKKYTSIFKNCENTNVVKFRKHINQLEDLGLITIDSSESWIERNTNPSIILKKNGIEFVEENISKIQEHWNN